MLAEPAPPAPYDGPGKEIPGCLRVYVASFDVATKIVPRRLLAREVLRMLVEKAKSDAIGARNEDS